MAIITQFHGAQITKPGGYSYIDVELNPQPLSAAGIVGVVGEALGGAPGLTDGVQTFASTQLYDIVQKYVSGPIVDAARALLAPSRDPDIQNGANTIKVYKTNASAFSSGSAVQMDDAAVPLAILTFDSNNYGIDENNVNFYETEGTTSDDQASMTSGVIALPVTIVIGETLVFTVAGAAYTFTVPAGGAGPHATVVPVLAMLNDAANWAPSKPAVATAVGTTKIKLTVDTSLAAFDGYESMHEYAETYLSGDGLEEDLNFRKPVAFATNGTVGGTFTVAALANLAANQWTQIGATALATLNVKITSITGTGPYTITVDNGLTDLSLYTTVAASYIFDAQTAVNSLTLEVTKGTAGWSRGQRGSRIFFIKKNTTLETISENANVPVFRIMYIGAGTACTMKILDSGGTRKLTTTVTGGPGSEALDITLSNHNTIQQLVDYISNFNAGASYTCYTDYYNAGTVSPQDLDFYNDIDIRNFPLDVKTAIADILANINTYSSLMAATRVSNIYGQLALISSTARRFLSGGVNGATTNSLVQTAFDALLSVDCDIVVPLFSQNASADILDGLTDSSSSYTISSVNAMADSHCRMASSTLNRRERTAFVALKDTYDASKTAAQLMNSEFVSMVLQDVYTLDGTGATLWKNPHVFAAMCAGMEAGAEIGMPLTKKALNCYGVRHSTFDPQTQYADAITNGLFFAEQGDQGGVTIVCGNTTYQRDSSFVWNRRSVIRASFYTAKTLRSQLESTFVGKYRSAGASLASQIKSVSQSVLSALLTANILAPDAKNGGLGYRGLKVTITGSIVTLYVIVTPVAGIDFVLANITLAPINDIA